MKKTILILICLNCCWACRTRERAGISDEGTNPPIIYTASELRNRLETAFASTDTDSIALFFSEWNRAVRPDSVTCRQNDTFAALYEIFRTVYKPGDLLKLGNWERKNELNAGSRYAAVQNKLYFFVVGSLSERNRFPDESEKDSIGSFRPTVDLPQERVLYLTPEYAAALNGFLNAGSETDSLPPGHNNRRYHAIRSYLPVVAGHWGPYWHLPTHPEISQIVLTEDLTHARVHFRVGYEGGEALLKKTNGKWTIVESTNTWIE